MSVRGQPRDRSPGGVRGRGAGAVLSTGLGRRGTEPEEGVQHLGRLSLQVGGRRAQFPRGGGRLGLPRGGVLRGALGGRSLRPAAGVELADGGLHDPEGLVGGGEGVSLVLLARPGDLVQEGGEGLDATKVSLAGEEKRGKLIKNKIVNQPSLFSNIVQCEFIRNF